MSKTTSKSTKDVKKVKSTKDNKHIEKLENIEVVLKKYIKELINEINTNIRNTINGDDNIFAFNDGCQREFRDELYSMILLCATLKQNLKDENENGEHMTKSDKYENIKNALEFIPCHVCSYFEYPDYIKDYFLV